MTRSKPHPEAGGKERMQSRRACKLGRGKAGPRSLGHSILASSVPTLHQRDHSSSRRSNSCWMAAGCALAPLAPLKLKELVCHGQPSRLLVSACL
eukprot:6563082-Pyramimonas_sp.AAC.1